MIKNEGPVVIIDFGSQYTQLIARRIRALNVFSLILPPGVDIKEIKLHNPSAVILSGGPGSVYDKRAPRTTNGIFDMEIPVLGVCYGMQYMTAHFGGKIEASGNREYGYTRIEMTRKSPLFTGVRGRPTVWMSHGDHLLKLPSGFRVISRSENAVSAIEDERGLFYGVQFHPEVVHTQSGMKILSNFLFKICNIKKNWSMPGFIDTTVIRVRELVGSKKVVLGLSGGVDSSVLAVLLHKAIGKQLTCVFINNGVLRLDEEKKVQDVFKTNFDIKLKYVNASKRFLTALKGVTDPEKKRKIIGKIFIDEFYAALPAFDFLAQGTLYPDVIESISTGGPSDTIKTHHNRVSQVMKLKRQGRVIEPFEELFKDEVREVGRELGLPSEVINRHPFPGPGLAIRILGEVTRARLAILKKADHIAVTEIKKAGLYNDLWQVFTVLLPVKSVGVMGDKRTYGYTIALRAVESVDAMTADFAMLPKELFASIAGKIVGTIKEVNRVVYDITSKPPGTIEWE